MTYTVSVLDEMRKKIAALPKPDQGAKGLNKRDAIGFLAGDLISSLREGHTPQELAALLAANGMKISVPVLRNYLSHHRMSKRKQRPTIRKPDQETTPTRVNNVPGRNLETRDGKAPDGANKSQEKEAGIMTRAPSNVGESWSSFLPRKDSDEI